MYQESLADKAKTSEELSKLTYKTTVDAKNLVDTIQSDFNVQVDIVEAMKDDMKLIVKSDNMNSKQITELEQSEGGYFKKYLLHKKIKNVLIICNRNEHGIEQQRRRRSASNIVDKFGE